MIMNLRNLFILISFFTVLVSCRNNQADKEIFNGEIHYINDKQVADIDMAAKHVYLDGDYTGMIAVYDSLLMCWEPRYQGFFLNLFNVDTGKNIGYFCPKGKGPNEFSNINPVYQLFRKDGDIMTVFCADSKYLVFWNVTESLRMNETVYDTIIQNKREAGLFFFYMPDNSLLNLRAAEFTSIGESTTPYYERYSLEKDEKVINIPIYKSEYVRRNSVVEPVGRFFNTWDAIKPDGTKVVQAMSFLPQLNIIDTRIGKVDGYRIKGGPDYSLLETNMKALTRFYTSVQADDKYIYATYWGKKSWGGGSETSMPEFDQIHVFDWNGNLLYRIKTDQSFFITWLDTKRNLLYTRDWNTDEIYYLDLKELDL